MTWNLNLKNTDECDTDNHGNVSLAEIRKIIKGTGSTEKRKKQMFSNWVRRWKDQLNSNDGIVRQQIDIPGHVLPPLA